ncbi:MAG: alpha-galactosidase [Clostridiales bacterium]|nr:alpha-galactosidase [Clostridiales bacterium]
MDFLRNNRRFDFLYGGKELCECEVAVSSTVPGNELVTVYAFADGLRVTNIAKKHEKYGAYEWVNYLENISDKPTNIISELSDGDFCMPFAHEDDRRNTAYVPDMRTATKIYAPMGSTWSVDEFYCDVDKIFGNRRENHIYTGETKRYSTSGGRSSVDHAPFFNITKSGSGIIFAIGWTGQWKCSITRGNDDVSIKTGIEDACFRLLPGEKIRTSSIVVMPYECSVTDAQNKWRRLVKEQFSLVGKPGRYACGPLAASIWGGMKTESVMARIKTIKDNSLPFDHVWMDAGWYGADTMPTPDEFEGDWPQHTGDWTVSPKIHPGGLEDVSGAIHEAGMKFILWFEPERVIKTTPIVKAHPEYFIARNSSDTNLLLNLGNEQAWEYCFNTLSGLIGKLNVDFYRQDFNFDPLEYWRSADAPDRRGITEIKHISGLYRLWDALLERFPHLMIDNCASGGRRLDIETLRRSIPLWRSDYMCPANFEDYAAQCHNLTFNTWLTWSGTGTGRIYDLYHIRSCYSAALTTNYAYSERDSFGDDPEKLSLIKRFTEEYIKVRPYFSEDFYPLTEFSDKTDVWCAAQFDRPERKDGIIQIFRRENSPYSAAEFNLGNVKKDALYTFTDADGGQFTVSGEKLSSDGFVAELPKPRTAKIYFYSYK